MNFILKSVFTILFAAVLSGCGGGVNILPEPFTRERADGKIPVKTDLIREQVRKELDGVPEGEAEVARWQAIERDYNNCRLSSAESSKEKAEEVFAVCMSEKGYVYMFPIDAEQFHNDIAFEESKRYPEQKRAEAERIAAAEKKQAEEEERARQERITLERIRAQEAERVRQERIAAEKRRAQKAAAETAQRKFNSAFLVRHSSNDADYLRQLLADGVNVNVVDKKGWTALIFAADEGHAEVAKMLLSAGANPNFANNKYVPSALKRAIIHGHAEVAKMLLSAGANPNKSAGWDPWSPLMYAAKVNTEVVKVLLSAGANVNAATEDANYTALMGAAIHGNAEIIKVLLSAGAIVNIKYKGHPAFDYDSDGNTALDFAKEEGHSEVVRILEEAGAE